MEAGIVVMKFPGVIFTSLLVSGVVVWAVGGFNRQTPVVQTVTTQTEAAANLSTYDRVIKDKTLRCGFTHWPPYIVKDPATGQMAGFMVDYMEEFGRAFDMKVTWETEISMTDIPSALNSGKIDAYCAPIGYVPPRTVVMGFSKPVLYVPLYAYARADDTRFDNNLDAVNKADITLSTMEAEYTSILARTAFPQAKQLEITGIQGSSTLFLNVANKKADVVFQDPASFHDYDAKNPDVLRKIEGGLIGAFVMAIPVRLDDARMIRLLNAGITDLESRMVTKQLAQKHGLLGGNNRDTDVYLPAPEYQH